MRKIAVCYKWVLSEADITITANLDVDKSKATGKINEYDRNAIAAAVKLKASYVASAIAGLTVGGENTKASLKDALSRGLDEVYWVNTGEKALADHAVITGLLAAELRNMEDVDLVICSEGSSDAYARQTAPRLGVKLDWPVITSVVSVSIDGDTLTAVRQLEECVEVVEARLPAVVSVLPAISEAPLPTMKGIISANKKPKIEVQAETLGVSLESKLEITGERGYAMARKNNVFNEGTAAEKVEKFVSALKKEGVM